MAEVRNSPGLLGVVRCEASLTVVFQYVPRKGSRTVVVTTRPDRAGTVLIRRRSAFGVANAGTAGAVAVAAGAEDQQEVAFKMPGVYEIVYENTDATAGVVRCEVTDDGG